MLPVFCQFSDGINFLAGGIGREVYELAKPIGDPASFTHIMVEQLKRTYDDLMLKSGATFTFETRLIAVETEGRKVTHAICSGKRGPFAVRAKAFVDATGNGDMATWAGASFEKGDENGNMMPPSLMSVWCNIDDPVAYNQRQQNVELLEKAHADGVFTVLNRHLPGIWNPCRGRSKAADAQKGYILASYLEEYAGIHRGIGIGLLGHLFGVDGTDDQSMTEGYIRGRKLVLEYERYYKEYLKGFEGMELLLTAPMMGIRETRRIMGDYVLCLDDFKRRAVFDDEIGRYSYPADVHAAKPSKQDFEKWEKEFSSELRYKPGESYGIPYRILTPKGLDNLWVGGRCVSVDRHILGSIRVQPACLITGQAAGAAAALAIEVNTSSHALDVKQLQRRLKAMGGFLPNLDGGDEPRGSGSSSRVEDLPRSCVAAPATA